MANAGLEPSMRAGQVKPWRQVHYAATVYSQTEMLAKRMAGAQSIIRNSIVGIGDF
jgi:hypothetical protein